MDRIDELNRKEKMKKSIIKWWRVNFVSPDEASSQEEINQDDSVDKAMEIYERLQAEAAEDEARKVEEQKEAYAKARWMEQTGADDLYGQRSSDDEDEKARIERILAEKEERIKKVVNEHQK